MILPGANSAESDGLLRGRMTPWENIFPQIRETKVSTILKPDDFFLDP